MNSLARFLMQIKASPADTQELRLVLPELFEIAAGEPAENASTPFTLMTDELVLILRSRPRSELPEALRRWAAAVGQGQAPEQSLGDAQDPQSPHDDHRDDDERSLRPLILAGGDRPGAKQFLNLATQVRAKNCAPEEIRTVIITDRYLHDSQGEDGGGAGYGSLLAYLSALGLGEDSTFVLEFSPAMRGASAEKIEAFEARLSRHYANATIGRHHPGTRFHDRLFLVHDTSARVHGIFGPSLNGLDAGSLYVMGELDDSAIKRVRDVLRL